MTSFIQPDIEAGEINETKFSKLLSLVKKDTPRMQPDVNFKADFISFDSMPF